MSARSLQSLQRPSGRWRLTRHINWGLVFVAPALALLVVFYILPIGYSAWLSFHDVGLREDVWVGLDNYRSLMGEEGYWGSIRVTLKFVSAYLFVTLIVSYAIALVLSNVSPRLCGIMLTAYHVPGIFSALATVTYWRWFYRYPDGGLNGILGRVGLPTLSWLADTRTVVWAITFLMLGGIAAGETVLYTAAIGQIDSEIIEAARVDGANWWQVVWYIITPLTNRMRVYLMLVCLVGGLLVWEHPFFLTGGGPLGASTTLMLNIYHKGFVEGDMGVAAAMTSLLTVGVVGIAVVMVKYLREHLG